jgi:hypothetical protein
MTKSVRIENADTSNHVLVADVFDGVPSVDGKEPRSTHILRNPTDMQTLYVHQQQFIVLREASPAEVAALNASGG